MPGPPAASLRINRAIKIAGSWKGVPAIKMKINSPELCETGRFENNLKAWDNVEGWYNWGEGTWYQAGEGGGYWEYPSDGALKLDINAGFSGRYQDVVCVENTPYNLKFRYKNRHGTNLLTNGGFDVDTTGWTADAFGTLSVVSNGQFGNGLALTRVSGVQQTAYQDITTTIGNTYRLIVYVKSGTSGDEAFQITIYENSGWTCISYAEGTSSSEWQKIMFDFTAQTTTTRIYLVKLTSTDGNMLFDTISCIDMANILANGGFDSDTTSWSALECSLASVAGGQSGSYLQLTQTGTTYGYQDAYQGFSTTPGKTYRLSAWVKSGSSGNEMFKLLAQTASAVDGIVQDYTTGTWTLYETDFVASDDTVYVILRKDSTTEGFMCWDSVCVREKTDRATYALYDVTNGAYITPFVELIINGTFDSDVDDWTGYNGTLSWDASGALKLTRDSGSMQAAYQDLSTPLTNEKAYKITYRIKADAAVTASLYRILINPYTEYVVREIAATTSWVTYTDYFKLYDAGDLFIRILFGRHSSDAGWIMIDDVSLVQVDLLPNSIDWSDEQSIDFVTPSGCSSLRVKLLGWNDGDIVWFDDVSLMKRFPGDATMPQTPQTELLTNGSFRENIYGWLDETPHLDANDQYEFNGGGLNESEKSHTSVWEEEGLGGCLKVITASEPHSCGTVSIFRNLLANNVYTLKFRYRNSGAFADLPNMVRNGDFTDDVVDWSNSVAYGYEDLLDSIAGGQSGNCLRITNGGGGYSIQYASQRIALEKDIKYRMSCYFKQGSSGAEANGARLAMYDFEVPGDLGSVVSTPSDVWRQHHCDFQAYSNSPVDNEPSIVVLKNTSTDGTMLFDTVHLCQISLVRNGNFTWTVDRWNSQDCSISCVSGGESGNCLQLTRTGGSQQYAYNWECDTKLGKLYRCTAWVKSGTSGNETAKLEIWDYTGTPSLIDSDSLTTSGSWQKLTVDFVAESTVTYIRLVKDSATDGTMLFDTVDMWYKEWVVNGGFDSDTSGWSASDCTLASVSGGHNGNGLELTRTGGTSQYAYQDITVTVNYDKTYRVTAWAKSGTSGAETARLEVYDTDGSVSLGEDSVTTSDEWQMLVVDIAPTNDSIRIRLYKDSSTAGTMLFDSVSMWMSDRAGYFAYDANAQILLPAGTSQYTRLPYSSSWSEEQTLQFELPKVDYLPTGGPGYVQIGFMGWCKGDYVYFDNISLRGPEWVTLVKGPQIFLDGEWRETDEP